MKHSFTASFEDVGSHLCDRQPADLISRIVLFSREAEPHQFYAADKNVRYYRPVEATISNLLSCMGAPWNVKAAGLRLLHRFSADLLTHTTKPYLKPYTQEWQVRELAATCAPTKFESDLNMYTSGIHTRPPQTDSTILCFDCAPNFGRAIVAFDSAVTTEQMVSGLTTNHPVIPLNTSLLLRKPTDLSVDFTRTNLGDIQDQLSQMQYAARRNPSYSKLNYVLHLQDHLFVMASSVQRLSCSGRTEKQASDTTSTTGNLQRKAVTYGTLHELEALRETTAEHQREAKRVYEMIKDQVSAKDSARNKLFAVLAAIYLPFTLASGILGMNIREFTGDNASPPEWSVLLVIGLPLAAATIALPLSFDNLYRMVRRFANYRPSTFNLAVCIAIPVSIFIVIGIAVAASVTVTHK